MLKIQGICLLIFVISSLVDSSIPPRETRTDFKPLSNRLSPRKLSVDASAVNYRLPNNTRPLHYDIHLTTHVHDNKFEFEGHVIAKFVVKSAPLDQITLHMKKLKNLKVKLLNTTSNVIENDLDYDTDDVTDFLIIKPKISLTIDQNYYLEFEYDGELRDDNLGFYKSSYVNEQSKTVWLATTQFESVEARSAFPCWDEPNIRTPFKIRITHGENYRAISNMPEKPSVPAGIPGYVTTEFEESFSIQTYLVAFIISDFKNNYDDSKPIKQRVFAKAESIDADDGKVALKYGVEILTKFAEYLDVPYFDGKLSKMDQFAMPDFDAGAMENFGLVTYREEYLLHNKSIDTTRQKENVLTIVSHEFAHMYFGDLVCPEWWNYLWLNEGFATLYEFYLVSLVYESDRLMDSFLLNVVHPVLEVDGSPQRPMTYYVEEPSDIDDLFDWIAYEKAGSVLRMMQNAMGDSTWRKGLKYYLTERMFNDARPSDLHKNLQKAVDEDGLEVPKTIDEIMLSWENQAGYPLITVDLSEEKLTFTQKRFLYVPETASEGLWHVPINYISASDSEITTTKADLWMSQQNMSIARKDAPKYWNKDDWIIVNVQQGYYYRVNYDNKLWTSLTEQLNSCHDKIDIRNRGQLIDDSFNLARAGIVPYDIPFGIIKYLKNEIDYVPWQSAYGSILLLNRLLSGLNVHKKYQNFIKNLVEPFYTNIGSEVVENEHKFKRLSRTIAYNLACRFEHESCLTETKSKIGQEILHPDLQEAIYSNGLRDVESKVYEDVIKMMLESKNQAERTLLIRALASTQNEELLPLLLNLGVSNEPRLRLQERYRIFSAIPNAGAVGAKVAMKFIEENYLKLNNISSSLTSSILGNIAPLISSEEPTKQFNQLVDFLVGKEVITESRKQSVLKIVSSTKEWQDKYVKNIEEWLDQNGSTVHIISAVVLTFSFIVKLLL
ncbi:aminopeptidase N-like [Chironomus tepperi]|uniref:aminopeptidase N-like n=1 Tax=Chironomus tepperi TaxID=113505 RepID=UPI00391F929B